MLCLFEPGTSERVQVSPPSELCASTPRSAPSCDVPLTYSVLPASPAASRVVALSALKALPARFQDCPASSERQTRDKPASISTLLATAAPPARPGIRATSAT